MVQGGRACIHLAAARYCDRLLHITDLKRGIDADVLIGLHLNLPPLVLAEARMLNAQAIGAHRQ